MSKKSVTIILGISCLLLLGAGFLSPCLSVETIQPDPDPLLNPEPLKEVMIFGASGTLGDGILKALLMDKNVQKIQVITRRLTPRIAEGVKLGKIIVTNHTSIHKYAEIYRERYGVADE